MDEEKAEEKAKNEAPLIKEAHQMLVKWEQGDPEIRALWEKMNSWVYAGFDETYKASGRELRQDLLRVEYLPRRQAQGEEGLKKGLFFRKDDGSVWADLTNEGLDQKLLIRKPTAPACI
jgi:arginyl-tRNA synthetase